MIKDYIEHLDSTMNGTISEATLSQLIQITIPMIGHPALIKGSIVILDWSHFESTIKSKLEPTDLLHDFLYAHICIELNNKIIDQNHNNNTIQFTFDNPQSSLAFFHFMAHSLPIKNHGLPVLCKNKVTLTDEQFHFFNRTTMLSSHVLPKEFIKDFFLKTLRADEFDFSSNFLTTLFNAEENKRTFQNLRPTNRRDFIVDSDGNIHDRHVKVSSEQKRRSGFTQIQSTTLIDETLITPVFGFALRDPLYGIMTHRDDLIISQLLVRDGGTVGRSHERDDLEEAHKEAISIVQTKKNRNQSPDQKLLAFKKENIQARLAGPGTNEVLAKLRFNPHRCIVSICAWSLRSRLLGSDFSEELLENFTKYSDEKGYTVNPTFKIPVVKYTLDSSGRRHNLLLYTSQMRQNDINECSRIFANQSLRIEHYKRCEFEFILGLDELTLDIFKEEVEGVPLALYMLQRGYARMLLRLLRPARLQKKPLTDQNLLNNIINELLARNLIEQNDPVIAELIRIEAFELAGTLIDKTRSSKLDLPFNKIRLIDHLLEFGNPRQMMFMGLDNTLIRAANSNHWVTVTLSKRD